jgi:hypothetical protein
MDFELPLFFYHQGRRLATVVLELRRPVSNLSKVFEALEKRSVPVLGLTSWLPGNDSESAGFLLAVDLTELPGGPNELVRELAEVAEVTDVRVLESGIEGLTTVIQGVLRRSSASGSTSCLRSSSRTSTSPSTGPGQVAVRDPLLR